MSDKSKNKAVHSVSKPLPELLAPAGNPDALKAAIAAGADAVYMGGGRFNARMRAKNFTPEEMAQCLAICRANGVKSCIAMNIRLYDREMKDFLSDAYRLLSDGADAFIIADLGAAALLKKHFPQAELHASTQLTGQTTADGLALKYAGFSRMVCPREMSLCDIRELAENSPVDIEMFIHGAHCVCVSGQCLASFSMGGRSGNRGECAQPCRLPYSPEGRARGEHPLSLRDMCLASHIPEIIETGAASLKIEGRQKSARYVYGAVSIYRRLLDQRRAASEDEILYLSELFSRDGFTDGYFTGRLRSMTGMRRQGDNPAEDSFDLPELKKVPISANLSVTKNNAVLCMKSPYACAEAQANARAASDGEPSLSPQAAEKNTGRLGSTPFFLDKFTCDIEKGSFFTLSELNRLRRDCVNSLLYGGGCGGVCTGGISGEKNRSRFSSDGLTIEEFPGAASNAALCDEILPDAALCDIDSHYTALPGEPFYSASLLREPIKTAVFESAAQITPAAQAYFDEIYLPWYSDRRDTGIFLPPLAFGDIAEKAITQAKNRPYVLCHTPGQISRAAQLGLNAHASFRLGVFNGQCAGALRKMGASSVTLSPELTLRQAEDIPGESMIIWGRLPLMLLARCVISDGGEKCKNAGFGGIRCGGAIRCAERGSSDENNARAAEPCRSILYDRKGEAAPVIGRADCTNVMYNSRPVYMADRMDLPALKKCRRHVYLFSCEAPHEVDRVIQAYRSGTPAQVFGNSFKRL